MRFVFPAKVPRLKRCAHYIDARATRAGQLLRDDDRRACALCHTRAHVRAETTQVSQHDYTHTFACVFPSQKREPGSLPDLDPIVAVVGGH